MGAKTFWFDRRLLANVTAYDIERNSMQVPLVRSSDQAPYVGNIGRARSIGVEGEFEARPTDTLRLGLNTTVQDARVTEITATQSLISGALKGSKLASPMFRVGGYVRHDFDLGHLGEAYVRLDAQHVGHYPNAFPDTPGAATLSPTYAIIPA